VAQPAGTKPAASYLDHDLGRFLDLVASRAPAPGGGTVAAIAVSLAAGLVAMAARFSTSQLDSGDQLADDADRLRARAAGLADTDAEAYGAVLEAVASKRENAPAESRERIRAAWLRAAEVPLEIAEIGAEIARLAALLAVEGNPNLRGDAATALLLSEAAVRSAAQLVAINVEAGNVEAGGCDEELVRRAERSADVARDASRRAQGVISA